MSDNSNIETEAESKKLSKLSNEQLIFLALEAQKIREELGDTPEIKDIDSAIEHLQSYQHKLVFIARAKLLYGIACFWLGYDVIPNSNISDLWGVVLMIGSFLTLYFAKYDLASLGDNSRYSYSKLSPYIDKIKLRIENLKLASENEKLNRQLQDSTEELDESTEELDESTEELDENKLMETMRELIETIREDSYGKRR